MIKNPISEGILHVGKQFKSLDFNSLSFIPSLITSLVLLIVMIIMIILWPYGLLIVMEDFLRMLMSNTRIGMNNKTITERIPFVIEIGIYFIVWIPFFLLCLPFLITGAIGKLFTITPKQDAEKALNVEKNLSLQNNLKKK